jgi:hypothetical protein
VKPKRLTKRNLGIAFSIIGGLANIGVMIVGIILLIASKPPKWRKIFQVTPRVWGGIFILGILLGILAWSPWISDQYAVTAVVDSLGGPDATYNYLGENVTVGSIPTHIVDVPFGKFVYFPGEAMYIVPFWGGVLTPPSLGLDSAGD